MRILPILKSKEYHHVCTECINDVKELDTNANEESWQRSLCKIANTTDGENHLRSKHGDSQALPKSKPVRDSYACFSFILYSPSVLTS